MWFQWHPSVLLAPVVFQCGLSSGIPVYWQNMVWMSLGQVTFQHATPYVYNCYVRVVWAKLISLDLQLQIHKNYEGAHTKVMRKVMLQYSHFKSKTVIHCRAVNLEVKAEFTETCPLADWCPTILSFQTGMDVILLNYMCLGRCGRLQSPSGLPV